MVRHAMAYVQMAQRVESELTGRGQGRALRDARLALHAAEIQLVRAYGAWHTAMEQAANEFGSDLAKTYLERTTWDLT